MLLKERKEHIIKKLQDVEASKFKEFIITLIQDDLYQDIVEGHDNGYFDGSTIVDDYYINGFMLPLGNL